MDVPHQVREADRRIDPFVHRTRVSYAPWLSAAGNCRVYLKMENEQHTGSFKFRGAVNKLLSLPEAVRNRGVVAASTGNHGLAVARSAAELGCQATIFAPETANAGKLATIREYDAEVRRVGEDCVESEAAARAHAEANGQEYVSPYNDEVVIAGQGTIGLELERQLANLGHRVDAVFASVGGGGLIAGVGGYLKAHGTKVIGASPKNSAVMHASIEAGELLDLPSLPTLSDGTAGGVEAGAITFALCRDTIDEFVLVEEDAIRTAMRETMARHHVMIEGAAGVAVAAFLACGDRFQDQTVAIVLCGANLDTATLKEIL